MKVSSHGFVDIIQINDKTCEEHLHVYKIQRRKRNSLRDHEGNVLFHRSIPDIYDLFTVFPLNHDK